MTSLLPRPDSTRRASARVAEPPTQPPRRPLAVVATLAGVTSALATLALCLVLALVGWYLADGGGHGSTGDALRVGALGWLTGLGSGVHVLGAPLTAVPLGLTSFVAVTLWRVGLRVGDAVSGFGPDAEDLADGEHDLTVPIATALLTAGFVIVAVLVATFAATAATDPDTTRVTLWSLALCVVVAGPAIAIGSGRAAIWTATLPDSLRVGARLTWRITQLWLAASLLTFVIALAVDFSTAANVVSELHADTGAAVSMIAVSLVLVPNATLFSGAYLMGPGFAVGTHTLVSPAAVVLGPLPLVPLLAALPDQGPTPAWTAWLVAVPPLLAAIVTALVLRRHPTTRWEVGVLRGLLGGIGAGLVVALLTGLAGGAVGPGRMQHVAPFVHGVLLHGVAAFGLGGLIAGLAMTWWERRQASALDAESAGVQYARARPAVPDETAIDTNTDTARQTPESTDAELIDADSIDADSTDADIARQTADPDSTDPDSTDADSVDADSADVDSIDAETTAVDATAVRAAVSDGLPD